jgi:Lon protease-like protein
MIKELPILPVAGVVFFPHTSLPIHINVPAYVEMIKLAVQNHTPIVVSLANSYEVKKPGQALKTYFSPQSICGAGHPLILEEYPNGGIKILLKGIERVQLIDIVQDLPYAIYKCSSFSDNKESLQFISNQIERLDNIFSHWLTIAVPDSVERESFLKSVNGIHSVVDYICMFLVTDIEIRQILLECPSLVERIQMLSLLIKNNGNFNPYATEMIKRFEFIEHLQMKSA